jgi:hypothetical protein
VAKARGKVGDPDEVINGFCLRILGRVIDLTSLTGGAGRRWTDGPYSLKDLLEGRRAPTSLRWPRKRHRAQATRLVHEEPSALALSTSTQQQLKC